MNRSYVVSLVTLLVGCASSQPVTTQTAWHARYGVPSATPSALHLLPASGAPDIPAFGDTHGRDAISPKQRAYCNQQCHAELTEEECQMWTDGLRPRKCAWMVPMIGEDD